MKVIGVTVPEVNSFRYSIYLVSYLTFLPQDVLLQAKAITLCPNTTAHRQVIDLPFKAAAYMHMIAVIFTRIPPLFYFLSNFSKLTVLASLLQILFNLTAFSLNVKPIMRY